MQFIKDNKNIFFACSALAVVLGVWRLDLFGMSDDSVADALDELVVEQEQTVEEVVVVADEAPSLVEKAKEAAAINEQNEATKNGDTPATE